VPSQPLVTKSEPTSHWVAGSASDWAPWQFLLPGRRAKMDQAVLQARRLWLLAASS